ncbi:Fic family protein, partial [Kingella kingae]|uniref:Fic family protein n=1 Tax=Kingella kingae TaxID=504 RepID=UPI00254EF389
PEDDNWQKPRVGLTPYSYLTRYSPLEKSDFQNAENAIKAAKPENMQNLSFDDKVKRLANVYAEIDYLHAFWDGNSRVNRAFVQELARSSGIKIDFDTNKISEKDMYIARDKSLAELNLSRRGEDLKKLDYKPNPYNEQKEIVQDLNTYYPNISLFSVFKNAASEIKVEQQVKSNLTHDQWKNVFKAIAEKTVQSGGNVTVQKPVEQAKIQQKSEGQGQTQKSPKPKI